MRIGQGLDLHRLEAGHKLWLGGVQIESALGAVGHSDGDALLHAITDALLGAIGLGDIGDFFPPSESQWKGVASSVFLAKALEEVSRAGFQIENIDSTIILERPKLGVYKAQIQQNIADLLGIEVSRVGVKAKTAEGILGELGEGKAVLASAVALLSAKALFLSDC